MYFRGILAEGQFLHCILSNARSFSVTAQEYLSRLIFLSLNHKSLFFRRPTYFFEVCGKSGGPQASLSFLRRKCVLRSLFSRVRASGAKVRLNLISRQNQSHLMMQSRKVARTDLIKKAQETITGTATGTTKSNRFNEQNRNSFQSLLIKDKPYKGNHFTRFTATSLLYQLRRPNQIFVMLLACEQVPWGPLGAGTAESPFCSPPGSQSSPEKLLAGYVTGCSRLYM